MMNAPLATSAYGQAQDVIWDQNYAAQYSHKWALW